MSEKNNQKKRGFTRGIFLTFRSFGLHRESNFFIQNLAVLIGAGMGVTAALDAVYTEIVSWRMRSALREIIDDVRDGMTLSRALTRAQIVTPHTLSLVTLGELSGRLSENLHVAALQNEKESVFRARVRSALSYSIFVFMIAIIVGVGTAWFILPKIASFFTELKVPLPALTRTIIGAGVFLKTYGFVFIPSFFGVFALLFYFLFSFPKTKFIGHTILFHIPLIKGLILETEIARFGFLVGTMVRAGVPIHTVFELLPSTTTFGNYRRLYQYMSDRIKDGYSFARLFPEYPHLRRVLPTAVRQMIVAAEQSGTLSDTFLKIGSMYETKVETTSRNIPAFLEPFLLVLVGLCVGVLAIGVLLPVYQIGLNY